MDKKDEMKKLMEDSDEDGQDYGIPFDLNKIWRKVHNFPLVKVRQVQPRQVLSILTSPSPVVYIKVSN